MAKKIITSFILLFSLYFYANGRVSIYENSEHHEVKTTEKIINTTIDGQEMTVLLKIGEDKDGKVTSVTLEELHQKANAEKLIQSKRAHLNKKIVTMFSEFKNATLLAPLNVQPSCYSTCAKKYGCFDKATEAGVLLCAADCLIECS